jgi:hypothetical protein
MCQVDMVALFAAAAAAAAAGGRNQQWARDSNNALRSASGKCLDVPGFQWQQGAQMLVGLQCVHSPLHV